MSQSMLVLDVVHKTHHGIKLCGASLSVGLNALTAAALKVEITKAFVANLLPRVYIFKCV